MLGGIMKNFVPALVLTAAVVGTVPQLLAQSDPSALLKSQLRNLVTAQEAYWADHGTYTTDVSALGMYKRRQAGATPTPADSLWVQVVQAGGRSWWGRASHRAFRGKSCVVYVGTVEDFTAPPATDAAKARTQNEGEPLCDTF
jgi:hypothetical protein